MSRIPRSRMIIGANLAALLIIAVAIFAFEPAPPSSATRSEGLAEEKVEMRSMLRARRASMDGDQTIPTERVTYGNAPTPGWAGEVPFGVGNNDWEPTIVADPNSNYVYMETTRTGGGCGSCTFSWIALRVSSDGGATFGAATPVCALDCTGDSWQADPVVRVDGNGDLYQVWLTAPFDILFARSTDNGASWSTPVSVLGSVEWGDHPWITVSDSGQDVYIGFNKNANYQTSSHDFGATWSEPIRTTPMNDSHYYFSSGGAVLSDGTVVFTDSAYGCCPYGKFAHTKPVLLYAIRSTDDGATWQQIKIDTSKPPMLCKVAGCPKAQYGAQIALGIDDDDTLVASYNAGLKDFAPAGFWVRRSTNGGATWSGRTRLAPGKFNGHKVNAAFPTATGFGSGNFSVTWADNRTATGRYNVWESESTNGGVTWTNEVKVSDATTGASYKNAKGFPFLYGDYHDVAITSAGTTIAIFPEGPSYNGPGGTWYNREV